jgi:hypothetical protein
MIRTLILFLAFVVAAASVAQASSISVDLSKLDPDVAAKVVASQKTITGDAQALMGLGKEIAEAISQAARGVGVEVNEFIKTPAGYWTVLVIAWLLVIKPIVKTVILLLVAFSLLGIWYKSLRRFFFGENAYNFNSRDARVGCAFVHSASVVAIFILMIAAVVSM